MQEEPTRGDETSRVKMSREQWKETLKRGGALERLPSGLARTTTAWGGQRLISIASVCSRGRAVRCTRSRSADAIRTAIAKACVAAGIPDFSPHDRRHRRISLLHLRGVPWARIAEFVGQRKLSVTADTYSHVMLDEAEVDYAALLAVILRDGRALGIEQVVGVALGREDGA